MKKSRSGRAARGYNRPTFPSCHKIKVFSAIRKEAYDWGESALGLQTDELVLNLRYSKEHTELMFEANISATRPSKLVKPSARDPMERFLGFNTILHTWLRPPTESVTTERVFDFIYRHTFGRPRECIYVGKQIVDLAPNERTPDKIKEIVYKCALIFFTQYKVEIRPQWDERYDKLLTKIGCNILSERAVFTIFDKLRRSNGDLVDPFSYYVSRGLIGYSRAVADGGTAERIEFRPAGEYHFKAIELNQIGRAHD